METIQMDIRKNKSDAISLLACVMFGEPKDAEFVVHVFNKKTGNKKMIKIKFNGRFMEYIKVKGDSIQEYGNRFWNTRPEFEKFMNKII